MSIINKIFGIRKRPWEQFYDQEELHYDIPNVTLYDMVYQSSLKYPNYIAYQYFGKATKYKKFIQQVNKCALSFNYLGVKKGDIVTICMPNTPEAVIAFYALNQLGAIAHMIHPLSAETEIKDAIVDTKTKILMMIDLDYEKLEHIIDQTQLEQTIFVCAADSMPIFLRLGYLLTKKRKYKSYPKCKKYITFKKFMSYYSYSNPLKKRKLDKNTPAVILHSGGTSGKPKYVVLANRSFNVSAIQERIVLKNIHPGDSTLAIMPIFHGFGLSVCIHTPLTMGCYTNLVPQFDAKKFDVLIHKTKPTIILGVPTLYEALLNHRNVKNLDLSHLKYLVSGGDSITSSLEDEINLFLKDHHSTAQLTQGYGLSEGCAAVSLCYDEVHKKGSIGIPLPRNDIKIIDPSTRKEVSYNTIGEICISGPTIMLGYLNDQSESNSALQMHNDKKIWLHTGDMGRMDSDGYLYYEQRLKRMIITSGYNVYPSHVEEVIEKHPDVLQCSVVSMPHPYKQEVPKAFIVLKDGVNANLFKKAEIRDYCKKNLSHYMCPYQFVFRKSLPYTKLGKVDFRTLQDDLGDDEV